MSACVSPPHDSVSHIVHVAAIIAAAASTALPPRSKIIAPAVAASGFPVTAIQCAPCSGGFSVFWAKAVVATSRRTAKRFMAAYRKRRCERGATMAAATLEDRHAVAQLRRVGPLRLAERVDVDDVHGRGDLPAEISIDDHLRLAVAPDGRPNEGLGLGASAGVEAAIREEKNGVRLRQVDRVEFRPDRGFP